MALRVVKDGEKAPVPAEPLTVAGAAATGTTRQLLVATRDRIARVIDDEKTMARDLAALTKRLIDTVRDIEAIDAVVAQEAGKRAEVTDSAFDAQAI